MLVSGLLGRDPVQTTLWWLTDNQNVEKFLSRGSGKLRLTKLVLDIMKKARWLNLDVQPIWVSRDNPFLLKVLGKSSSHFLKPLFT
jgi:hypothetical protein